MKRKFLPGVVLLMFLQLSVFGKASLQSS